MQCLHLILNKIQTWTEMTWALEDQPNKPSHTISVVWQTHLRSVNRHRALDKYCVKVVFCSVCAVHSSCPRLCRLIRPANTDSSHSIRQSQSVLERVARQRTTHRRRRGLKLQLDLQPNPPGPESSRTKWRQRLVYTRKVQQTQIPVIPSDRVNQC